MKTKLSFILMVVILLSASLSNASSAREILLQTQSIDGAVHWVPQKVEVTAGEKIKFTVKHDLEGGFDFHGFFIPVLKVSKQVNRHKPLIVEVTVPKDLKAGEYPIGCQFHPKHVAATLIVKSKR